MFEVDLIVVALIGGLLFHCSCGKYPFTNPINGEHNFAVDPSNAWKYDPNKLELPLTSENVRFASRRCQEAFAAHNQTLKNFWYRYEFNRVNNSATHCYVKCFLRKLGLINLYSRAFEAEKFYFYWFELNPGKKEYAYTDLQPLFKTNLNDLCISYYEQWMALPEKWLKSFFASENLKSGKPIGKTASQFCILQKNMKKHLPSANCTLACEYEHFHYFDAYGRLDLTEILRSYQESNALIYNKLVVIHDCVNRANAMYNKPTKAACFMAQVLNECLLQQTQHFEKVRRTRNQLTMNY